MDKKGISFLGLIPLLPNISPGEACVECAKLSSAATPFWLIWNNPWAIAFTVAVAGGAGFLINRIFRAWGGNLLGRGNEDSGVL